MLGAVAVPLNHPRGQTNYRADLAIRPPHHAPLPQTEASYDSPTPSGAGTKVHI